MTVSAIAGITREDQPQELSSFVRMGVVYVVWSTPTVGSSRRLRWKPHTGADFTEIVPALFELYRNAACLYDITNDQLVVIWDDGTSVDGAQDGNLLTARFNPVTGAVISGPTVLFPGSNPKLAYRNMPANGNWVLYYRTGKNRGVYGRVSLDSGMTWESGYPMVTNQVSDSSNIEVTSYNDTHVSVAQVGTESRKLIEASMLKRTRPLSSIIKHPTNVNEFFVGEPSKFNNTTLVDNLRGALVLSTDNTKLYHLDGVQQGVADGINAVARIVVTGTDIAVAASAGPTGNGDDVNEYSLVPAAGTLNVDLPAASYAVALAVSSTHAYVAEYDDSSSVNGQFVVVDLSAGTTATVLSGITGARAVAVANFLATPLIFVATTEAGVERLRVYQQSALAPTLLLNIKITSRANFLSVAVDPANPTGVLVYASLADRLNIYKYKDASSPVQLLDSLTLPGGGSFFQSVVSTNGNIFVTAGTSGLLALDPSGRIIAQTPLSGKVVLGWRPSTSYPAGSLVRPRSTHPFANSRYYFTNAGVGTSGSAEPAWASSGTIIDSGVSWTPVGLTDGLAVGLALDESTKRVYVVGSVGGVLGTEGRVWLVTASGLL